jgi:hypothetical protein
VSPSSPGSPYTHHERRIRFGLIKRGADDELNNGFNFGEVDDEKRKGPQENAASSGVVFEHNSIPQPKTISFQPN